MRKSFLCLLLVSISVVASSCASTKVSKSKYSPYYFYADTTNDSLKISRHELLQFLTFDRLTYKGSYLNNRSMTKEDLENIKENRNLEVVPRNIKIQVGFLSESTNMRLYPTHDTIHRGNPKFDSNQYTRVSAFSPLFIVHTSSDGQFYYVLGEFMRGWLPADKITISDAETFTKMQLKPFIRIVKDNTTLGDVTYGIGDRVPFESDNGNTITVYTPHGETIEIDKNDSFIFGNAPYDETLIKAMAESQLENPYDWGGKEGYRDCSAYVRDLWRVFGADIPRSSGLQRLVGKRLLDKPKNKEEFFEVLKTAKPYKTLIFFKGHVMMYGGMEDNDYIIYHAVNSLVDDKGKKHKLAKVAKNRLFEEQFTGIWKRVIGVTEISPLISPELPKEPELIYVDNILQQASKFNSL